jgi:3-oxoadipate enol-lactonase
MSIAQVNGLKIHYQIDGNVDSTAPWLTLSHSLGCDLSMWDPQIEMLTQHFKVLRFDTRGHGKSSVPAGPYTLDDMALDVHGLLKTLGIQKTHWMGLSMGGMMGQAFVLRFPGIFTSMVLADSTSKRPDNAATMWGERIKIAREQGMDALVDSTLARWFTEPFRKAQPDIMKRIGDGIRTIQVEGFCGSCAAIAEVNFLDQLHLIDIPVLVMVGDQDHGTPPAMSEQMAANLPNSELVIIKDAAHISNIEQAAFFNKTLQSFYKKQGIGQ